MVQPPIPYLTRPGSQGSSAGSGFPSPRGLQEPPARMVLEGPAQAGLRGSPPHVRSLEEGGARGQGLSLIHI